MKNTLLLTLFLITSNSLFSQTGPGGIGNNDGSSSLELWIIPDSSIFTTGVLVDSILDLSGNGLKFSESGTNRPDLTVASLNGSNFLTFNRSDFEKLNLSANIASIGSNSSRTVLYVFRPTINSGDVQLLGTSNRNMIDYGSFSSTNRLRIRRDADNQFSNSNSVPINNWHIGAISYNGTNTIAWNNSTQIVNTSSNTFGWDINSSFDIGGANESGRSFNGDIAEVLLFSEAINTAQRIIAENYLAAKYGLSLATNNVYNETMRRMETMTTM